MATSATRKIPTSVSNAHIHADPSSSLFSMSGDGPSTELARLPACKSVSSAHRIQRAGGSRVNINTYGICFDHGYIISFLRLACRSRRFLTPATGVEEISDLEVEQGRKLSFKGLSIDSADAWLHCSEMGVALVPDELCSIEHL
jgi:hypothetical protein